MATSKFIRNMLVNEMTGEPTKTWLPLSSENAIRISHDGDREYTYVDQDYTETSDAPTLVTMRSEAVNSVSRNPLKKLVFAKSAKGGRLISGKRELVCRRLIDGVYYDDPIKLILTVEISNGAINELESVGAGNAAKFIASEITKLPDLFLANSFVVSNDNYEISLLSDRQPQIERMLYGNAEWANEPIGTVGS